MLTLSYIKSIVAPICRKYGIKKASLFGSYARGEATKNSDIDIYIEPGAITSLFLLSAFRLELMEALGLDVDIVSEKPDVKQLEINIQKDEVVLYAS